MMNLDWVKCKGNVWGGLSTVDLSGPHFDNLQGVYVIWHGGDRPATVRVGQGVIRDRLQAHRADQQVQAFSHLGLLVTWASVPEEYRDGVEAYLSQRLQPKTGERYPNVRPIEVNLPV